MQLPYSRDECWNLGKSHNKKNQLINIINLSIKWNQLPFQCLRNKFQRTVNRNASFRTRVVLWLPHFNTVSRYSKNSQLIYHQLNYLFLKSKRHLILLSCTYICCKATCEWWHLNKNMIKLLGCSSVDIATNWHNQNILPFNNDS